MTRAGLPPIEAVIPAHAPEASLLTRAVESALACATTERVIVVDGASPAAITRASLPGDGRVELVRTEQRGPSAARNVGLDLASAPWVLLLDHDDAAEPSGVEAGLRLARELQAVAVVSARTEEVVGDDGTTSDRFRQVPVGFGGKALARADDVFEPIALFGASGLLVRQDVLLDGVRYDEDLWIGEDRDFLRRVGARGAIAVNPEPAVRVRLHRATAGNLSSAAHLERRVRDHLVLLERWFGVESERHFEDATRWLLHACARAGVEDRVWSDLVAAARVHGWRVPMKTRWRRWRSRGGSGGGES
ncbi:MAG: glycosyltransferase family 2 protein [Phycisphaerales bacterium]|nr:MAG: glycosyltransferase family 2 protein [Phycisphaerales bacterium]